MDTTVLLTLIMIGLIMVIPILVLWVCTTTCGEGEIKLRMRNGVFAGIIHSVPGHRVILGPKGELRIVELKSGEKENRGKIGNLLYEYFGLFWLGIPFLHKIYSYNFQWKKLRIDERGNEVIEPRDEEVDSLYFRAEYVLEFKNMETSDNYKVNIETLLNTQIVVPVYALLRGNKWLTVVTAQVESTLREYVGNHKFEELRSLRQEQSADSKPTGELVNLILSLNSYDKGDSNICLEELVGIKITSFNFKDLELAPEGEPEIAKILRLTADTIRKKEAELKAAIEDVKIAKQKAEAKKEEAVGEEELIRKTLLVIASNPEAAKIEAIKNLPKNITHLVQEGAVKVNLGGK